MTVIAWDGKTLASDSCMSTNSGFYKGSVKKLFRLKSGGMLGCAGDADFRSMISLFDNIKDEGDLPTRQEIEALRLDGQYLLILPDRSAWVIETGFDDDTKIWYAQVIRANGKFTSVGHGEDFANTAMHLGKNATEAVKEACKWSLACRLPVQQMKLEDKPKEKIKRVRQPKPVQQEAE